MFPGILGISNSAEAKAYSEKEYIHYTIFF